MMSISQMPARTSDPSHADAAGQGRSRGSRARSGIGLIIAVVVAALWLVIASVIHLTQGTAEIDLPALWAAATGGEITQATAVLIDSRLPRLLAALLVGAALGMSGATMQSVTRNPLASPETTGVGAGAYLALALAAMFGWTLGPYGSMIAAFVGGIAAAAAVIGLSSGSTLSPVRLVLAGSVLTLGLASVTSVILLLFPWETQGLFAWGAGSLSQNGLDGVAAVAPIAAVAAVGLLFLGRRLDLLQLGDDTAAALGVPVQSTRITAMVLAVVLAAGAVTVTGPIGFVGLCAPAIVRMSARRLPALRRQRVFLILSAVTGTALILTADVTLRMLFGAKAGVTIPTGVLTSLIGAVFLVLIANRMRSGANDGESLITMRAGSRFARRFPGAIIGTAAAALLGVVITGILIGDSLILLGDVANWLRGMAAVRVEIIMDSRLPRVLGAALAGACLALAGGMVQAVSRNPLADPGVLGISAAAGLGGIIAITVVEPLSDVLILVAALIGATIAAILLFALGRTDQLKLVLVGVGVGAAASSLTTLLLIGTDPWNQTKALTWLGGSTYGASFTRILPMVAILILAIAVLSRTHRDLDALQFDDVSPRVWGVPVDRSRIIHIALAVALSAAATATIGVIAFVGLVAPHAARMLIGKRHASLLPLTALLGAILVVVGDLVGRAAIAPAQLPAGLIVALIGTPYFLWLLYRMRARR